MKQRDYELKQALVKRAEAKNAFIRISNDKKSKKWEILEYYKKYKVADDNLINVYEKHQKPEDKAYDKVS